MSTNATPTRRWLGKFTELAETVPPYAALAVSLAITALLTLLAYNKVKAENEIRFDRFSHQVVTAIETRMTAYKNALIHARSFFFASHDVTREEFKTYVSGLDIEANYPGILGIGYTIRIAPNELAAHENRVRSSGFPDYRVWPGYPRDEYFSILYLEPFNWRNQRAFGYDMFTENIRKEAMSRARDTGLPAVTAKVTLVQETEIDRQPGFLIYVPYYAPGAKTDTVEQRRAALRGFIYSPFRAYDLFEAIAREVEAEDQEIDFEVYASDKPSPASLLFDRDKIYRGYEPSHSTLKSVETVPIIGNSWTVVVTALPGFSVSHSGRSPFYILLGGLIVSGLVFRMSLAYQAYSRTLRKGEQQLRLVIDSVPALIAYIDSQEEVKFNNRYYAFFYGKHGERLMGRQLREVLGPLTYERRRGFVFRALKGERVVFEELAPHDGGEFSHLMIEYVPDFREDGTVAGFIVLGTDITEQKRIQKQLADQATSRSVLAELGKVLSTSLDYEANLQKVARLAVPRIADACAIWILERDGSTRSFFGIAPGCPGEIFNLETFSINAREWILSQLDHGETLFHPNMNPMAVSDPGEIAFLEQLKKTGAISHIAAPIQTRTQHIGGLSVVSLHSERQFTQADLDMIRDLASRIGNSVENSRLFNEARSLNRAKDEFLATLSHELRTPLNVIQGHSELLHSEPTGNPDIDESIDAIYRNAKVQTQIVNDLLDVSSIITGKVTFQPERLNVVDIVKNTVESHRLNASSKNVGLEARIDDDDMPVMGDAVRLQQILWNLLSNAIKFTPAGGRITVEARKDDGRCVLKVRDSGQGMDPAFLPYVFDRFRQEDNTMTRRFGGLGLGLSIVRNLVELHNGTVRAWSEGPGKGSEFTITLPLVGANTPETAGMN